MAINSSFYITLLTIFTIVGGLVIIFWPGLYGKSKGLRYVIGIGLLILGLLALLNKHIPLINVPIGK